MELSISLPNILMGLIGLALGVFMVSKAYYLNHHILFLSWAEQKWGPGSGTTTYRLVGLFLCVFSVFVIVGWVDLFGSAFGVPASGGRSRQDNIQTIPTNNTQNRIAD